MPERLVDGLSFGVHTAYIDLKASNERLKIAGVGFWWSRLKSVMTVGWNVDLTQR